jgi:hypothetical protein
MAVGLQLNRVYAVDACAVVPSVLVLGGRGCWQSYMLIRP